MAFDDVTGHHKATEQTVQQATRLRNCVAHAWLRSPVYNMLLVEAARRGEHPDRLAAEILNSVLLNGYVDAVLQERTDAERRGSSPAAMQNRWPGPNFSLALGVKTDATGP